MKKIICITVALLLLLLSGCNNTDSPETLSSGESNPSENITPVSNEITIYYLQRSAVFELLSNPSFETLQTLEFEAFEYTKASEEYMPSGGFPPKKVKEFIEAANDYSNVREYLSELGVDETIKRTTVFDSYDTQMVIMIETSDNVYFAERIVSIGDNGTEIKYEPHTKDDFVKMHEPIEADITVGGQLLELNNKAKLRYRMSEVPFFEVTKALGAEFEWKSDLVATMTLNGHRFELSFEEHYTIKEEGDTLNLFRIMPAWYLDLVGDELYIPAASLCNILYYSEMPSFCKVDRDNRMIYYNDTKE